MITKYKEYSIEVVNDREYTFNSVDNVTDYQFQYGGYDDHYGSRHGIKVLQNNIIISSAIVSGFAGATIIHEHSYIIADDKLYICCADHVFALCIPDLTLAWKQKADAATCFAIYLFKGDLIIHGELEITRIDLNGNIKWQFSARDIFVTANGDSSFEIIGDQIHLKDWQNYIYILNEDGVKII